MGGRSGNRQRHGDERPNKREQQQEYGNAALHASPVDQNPNLGLIIEQNMESRKALSSSSLPIRARAEAM